MTDEILKSSMCNVIRPARWTPGHVITSSLSLSLSLLGERKDHGARVRMVNWSYGTCRVYKVLDGRTRTGPCCDAPLCWSLCWRWARALTSERRRATERNGARPAGVGGVALVAAQRRTPLPWSSGWNFERVRCPRAPRLFNFPGTMLLFARFHRWNRSCADSLLPFSAAHAVNRSFVRTCEHSTTPAPQCVQSFSLARRTVSCTNQT